MQQVKQSSELIYAKYVVAYLYYVCMNEWNYFWKTFTEKKNGTNTNFHTTVDPLKINIEKINTLNQFLFYFEEPSSFHGG